MCTWLPCSQQNKTKAPALSLDGCDGYASKAKGDWSRGVLRNKCSENMQENTHTVFNKVALQLYWNRISTWVFTCKFGAYFHNTFPFPKNTASGRLLLRWVKKEGYTFLSPARIKNKRDKWIWRKTIHRKWNNISYCWMFQHFLILVVEHRQAIVQNWAEQCPRFRNNGTKLIMAGEGK